MMDAATISAIVSGVLQLSRMFRQMSVLKQKAFDEGRDSISLEDLDQLEIEYEASNKALDEAIAKAISEGR